uniref:Rhodanese domain-containing protein n=1 Tax=Rhodosorus marinus TaxID=101924 RepID=A0A7S3E5W8_9RHOD|mmetsp:Transcript_11447/g.47648  ORF Transcript_11447/g.47648 Transcript_11447/m.47648 type:complete len:219 (+) Transcript_11447:680-1336(+)
MISIEDKLSIRLRSGGCGNVGQVETALPPHWKLEAGFISSLSLFGKARDHTCIVCELRFSRTEFRPPRRPRNIIDIRTKESFARGHLPCSTSIPADELQERLLEMPPPVEDPLTLLGESEDHISAAQELLVGKGWELSAVFREVDVRDDLVSTDPSVQCWRPNDFLECVIEVLKDRLPAEGVAIDYGCGSGRDVVYLAQMLKGWRVIGVDNHSNALAR